MPGNSDDATVAYESEEPFHDPSTPPERLPGFAQLFPQAEKLGTGGWGQVYRFQDSGGAWKAVKFLHANLWSDTDRQRFQHEFEFLKHLRHPALTAVDQVGTFQDRHFYIMEWVDGRRLLHYLEQHPEELTRLFKELLEVLHFVHTSGVVHRDLKPENLMVDTSGHLRLLDFGIARCNSDSDHLTQTGALLGTPAYMSPEQIRGLELDERSDLYAAGVVLYQCLTGKRPFDGDQAHTVLYKVLQEEPDLSAVDDPYRCLVQWLLQKDRNARPRSALAILERWSQPQGLCTQCPIQRRNLWNQMQHSRLLTFLAGVGSGIALLSFF